MRRLVLTVLSVGAFLGVAACDAPTGPEDTARTQEEDLVVIAFSHGLSHHPIGNAYTIALGTTRYDVGCPLQCWLPQGIATLIEMMRDDGTLRVMGGSPPFVYVGATKVPVYLQNARPLPQCSNSIDDDGDGRIDWPADPGCLDAEDNDERDSPPDIRLPPALTAPVFMRGRIPFKGMLEWQLECPIQATLTSIDGRTWIPLGVRIEFSYVRFTPGQGWVEMEKETLTLYDRADMANAMLGSAGWTHTLRVFNSEARFTLAMLVRGSDGEELLVPANNGAWLFCGF